MNKVLKTKSIEFFSVLKKHIFKSKLTQYALVLILNLILFTCIEILPAYYVNIYVIKQRMTVLLICMMVILFSMLLQAKLLTYINFKNKFSIVRTLKSLLWLLVILLLIVVFSIIISTAVSGLQNTPLLRATIFGERLPQYINYLVFPIYSTSILAIVLTPELNAQAYLNKWIERFKETYLLLLAGGFVLGTIQTLCRLFLDKPIPQIVSVISTALLWSVAALYKKNMKRGKKEDEKQKKN